VFLTLRIYAEKIIFKEMIKGFILLSFRTGCIKTTFCLTVLIIGLSIASTHLIACFIILFGNIFLLLPANYVI
jgi:hypothetical protein